MNIIMAEEDLDKLKEGLNKTKEDLNKLKEEIRETKSKLIDYEYVGGMDKFTTILCPVGCLDGSEWQ
jgi:uncharacterized protein YlxW (UPF0749 family)